MRHATEADLPRIVEIYNSTIPSRRVTSDLEPVSIEARLPWFRKHTPDHRPIFVHEDAGRVVAWVSFESFYGRPAYGRTAEISIYIDEQHRGAGLGTRLLAEAMDIAAELGIRTLLAFIFAHNEPSLRLFSAAGFQQWGLFPRVAEMDGREYDLAILGKRL